MAHEIIPAEMLSLSRTARNFSFLLPFVEQVNNDNLDPIRANVLTYVFLDDQGWRAFDNNGSSFEIRNCIICTITTKDSDGGKNETM